jgi:peptidoglycan/LPS O-acetylase OafA/YrhL
VLITSLGIYMAGTYQKMDTWLTSTLFQYTGKISYSLYLIHWPIGMKLIDVSLRLIKQDISFPFALLLFVLSIGLSIGSAHLFYQWIESPCLNMSRKWRKILPDSLVKTKNLTIP